MASQASGLINEARAPPWMGLFRNARVWVG